MKSRVSTAGIAFKGEKVLLALRKPGTSIGESWEFPGGKVEENETPPDALKREYIEEFGIEIEVGELLCKGSFLNGKKKYTLMGFEIFPRGDDFNLDDFVLKEHSNLKWVDLEELSSFPMASSDRQIADCLLTRSQNTG